MKRVILDERLDDVAVEELADELVKHVEDFLLDELDIPFLGIDSNRTLNDEFKILLEKFFGLN